MGGRVCLTGAGSTDQRNSENGDHEGTGLLKEMRLATPNQQMLRVADTPAPEKLETSKGANICKLSARGLNFYYGTFKALHDIDIDIASKKITAFIGPSGCGKSTFLRTMNRMNEAVRNTRVEGEVLLDGENILSMDVTNVRRRVGMVFQKSNPFPKTIFDNVAYGLRV